MTEETMSAFDAIDEGPLPSDAARASAPRFPASQSPHPTIVALGERFGERILGQRVSAGDQDVVWIDPGVILEVMTWLKEDARQAFDMMSDVTGIDYGQGRPVEVVYQMYSTRHKHALRVRCPLALDSLEIDSVVALWQSANWLEREVFDMFGVNFRGHPDLRRILMPIDYAEGHPLRKDFPLRGRFSRAEQTRRALDQDVDRFYSEEILAQGREAQEAARPEIGTHGANEGEV
jgi:NADH-quinone oxidoreductase subunit C